MMFVSAQLDHKIDKATFEKEEPVLREALLNAQFDLVESKAFPVIIIMGGADGSGKEEVVNGIQHVMDSHYITTFAMDDPTDEERERPRMWRFWRALPPKGRIGIFLGSWYREPIASRALGKISKAEFDQSLQEINRFERMLADEGALILKFWFYLTQKQQKKRLKKLDKDPATRWRIPNTAWDSLKRWDKIHQVGEPAARLTSTGHAPWFVIPSADRRYRNMTTGRMILQAIRKRLEQPNPPKVMSAQARVSPPSTQNVLTALDLSQNCPDATYKKQLGDYQGRLSKLSRHKKFRKRAVVAVFEGNDAAGKGGAIQRVTQALEAQAYRVIQIAAPTEEERAQPYLWRFWRQVTRLGHFAIFDRSWYGRVLVERVEGFCSEADWMRAYSEINDFEQDLAKNGIIVVKFWLAISADEQLKRFKAREKTGYKRHKITEDDWRNRKKWDAYVAAVCDMVDRTSTEYAPWTLVEANDKNHARIKVLRTFCERIEAAL
ncbi:MAG: polyphosphate:AMP phosphotransferase [Candidatus Methylomirabilales bacterium]